MAAATRWISSKRPGSAWLLMLALALAVGLASCDDGPTGAQEPEDLGPDATTLFPGLTVSDVDDAAAGGSPLAAATSAVAYISACPGTFSDARMIKITNLANGKRRYVAPFDGGFDPVPLEAEPDDEIEILVYHEDGSTSRYLTRVPARKRPRVVRTVPSKDATDVVLSVSPLIVFSEPVDPSTVTPENIQLQLDGEPVESTVELRDDGLKAELTPAEPLEAVTTYTLVITTGVLDLESDGLEEEVRTTFTTEGPNPLVSVSAGFWHTCAVRERGEAFCWGWNGYGQLGHPPPPPDGVDTAIAPLPPRRVPTNKGFASLAVGEFHTCGLTAGGTTYCWGWNGEGELGDGTTTSSHVPVLLSGTYGGFVALATGSTHTCGLTSGGSAYCWGKGPLGIDDGQEGFSSQSATPVPVDGGLSFISLAGGTHMCGLTAGGDVYWWGRVGAYPDQQSSKIPVLLTGGPNFASLGSHSTDGGGCDHSCALTADGAAYCWGANVYGQLGNGTTEQSYEPVAVSGGHSFVSLAEGAYHTCGLTASGTAYCWGANHEGELGVGEAGGIGAYPHAVHGYHEFGALNAGLAHTCGVTADGDLYCWGYNKQGQLGIPPSATPAGWSAVPVLVVVP